tara:strand:+ start:909 stop:1100 length:192 start_codon:yes stop_codon:yes gene_type:complete
MAEEERFELSEQFSPLGHLANAWFKPLTHSSVFPYELFISDSEVKKLSLPVVGDLITWINLSS